MGGVPGLGGAQLSRSANWRRRSARYWDGWRRVGDGWPRVGASRLMCGCSTLAVCAHVYRHAHTRSSTHTKPSHALTQSPSHSFTHSHTRTRCDTPNTRCSQCAWTLSTSPPGRCRSTSAPPPGSATSSAPATTTGDVPRRAAAAPSGARAARPAAGRRGAARRAGPGRVACLSPSRGVPATACRSRRRPLVARLCRRQGGGRSACAGAARQRRGAPGSGRSSPFCRARFCLPTAWRLAPSSSAPPFPCQRRPRASWRGCLFRPGALDRCSRSLPAARGGRLWRARALLQSSA